MAKKDKKQKYIYEIWDTTNNTLVGVCKKQYSAYGYVRQNTTSDRRLGVKEIPTLDSDVKQVYRVSIEYLFNHNTGEWTRCKKASVSKNPFFTDRDYVDLSIDDGFFVIGIDISSFTDDVNENVEKADRYLEKILDTYPEIKKGMCNPKSIKEFDKKLEEEFFKDNDQLIVITEFNEE